MNKFIINISGKQVEVEISVNEDGNLVLGGIGSVEYEMYEEELILSEVDVEDEETNS